MEEAIALHQAQYVPGPLGPHIYHLIRPLIVSKIAELIITRFRPLLQHSLFLVDYDGWVWMMAWSAVRMAFPYRSTRLSNSSE